MWLDKQKYQKVQVERNSEKKKIIEINSINFDFNKLSRLIFNFFLLMEVQWNLTMSVFEIRYALTKSRENTKLSSRVQNSFSQPFYVSFVKKIIYLILENWHIYYLECEIALT